MLKMARYSGDEQCRYIKQIAYATDDNNHEGALNVIQAVLENKTAVNLLIITTSLLRKYKVIPIRRDRLIWHTKS